MVDPPLLRIVMSVVTGVLICYSLEENETPIVEIGKWLEANNKSPLHQLDEKMCNGKHPQMMVWGGGYNYLDNDEFIELFKSRDWINKEQVFMIFNMEEGPMRVIQPWAEYRPSEGVKESP